MNSPKRICVYGGTFDPAGLHHRQIATELAKLYDIVVVVPCGPRLDKATVNDRNPIHRAISVHWTFHDLERVEIDYSDLERDEFTRTHELVERYQKKYQHAQIWTYVGADNLERDQRGISKIKRVWAQAERMLAENLFTIHVRQGYPIHPDDLPRHYEMIEVNVPGSSSEIRELAYHRKGFEHLVVPRVAEHIERFDVYGGRPVHWSMLEINDPRPWYVVDLGNDRAVALARRIKQVIPGTEDFVQANFLSPICGDGGMLDLVQKFWGMRLPMVCLNAGTVGYMLNDVPNDVRADYFAQSITLYHFPLLLVTFTTADGQTHQSYAVNDAVFKADGDGQARISVSCDGQLRVPSASGDGVIVASVLGSSAYSFNAGGPLLPLYSQDLVITGICTKGSGLESEQVPGDTVVTLENLGDDRWPTKLVVDRTRYDNVVKVVVRYSRVASIMLGSLPGVGLGAKRLRHQFPKSQE